MNGYLVVLVYDYGSGIPIGLFADYAEAVAFADAQVLDSEALNISVVTFRDGIPVKHEIVAQWYNSYGLAVFPGNSVASTVRGKSLRYSNDAP